MSQFYSQLEGFSVGLSLFKAKKHHSANYRRR